MSIPAQPPATPPAMSGKTVTTPTLLLSLALAASVTAAIIFAVLYFRPPTTAAGAATGSNPAGPGADDLLVQKGTVSPGSHFTDLVYYEIPYASPPHLTLTTSKRQYTLLAQDEAGFTWKAEYLMDDFADEVLKKAETDMKVGNVKTGTGMLDYLLKWTDSYPLKPNLKYEDFSWEARGFRAPKGAPILTVFPQEGTFRALPGEQGEVGFKVPYATSPNVELSSSFHVHENLVIVECRPTGFKWKSVAKDPNDRGDVVWKAKGIRATEIPKSKPETP
jgi:hypothetical protein